MNTVLYESSEIAVIPALGALEAGHILIVTKRHYTSFAESGSECLQQACDVIRRLLSTTPAVVSEHGSVHGCGGGACINHAHISVLPSNDPTVVSLELERRATVHTLAEIQAFADRPYLLLANGNAYDVFEGDHIPSQLIRRLYCMAMGRDDWDWALFPAERLVAPTIAFWNSRLAA